MNNFNIFEVHCTNINHKVGPYLNHIVFKYMRNMSEILIIYMELTPLGVMRKYDATYLIGDIRLSSWLDRPYYSAPRKLPDGEAFVYLL